jgi:hypothetical protein
MVRTTVVLVRAVLARVTTRSPVPALALVATAVDPAVLDLVPAPAGTVAVRADLAVLAPAAMAARVDPAVMGVAAAMIRNTTAITESV